MPAFTTLSRDEIQKASSEAEGIYLGRREWDSAIFARVLGERILEQFLGVRLIGEIERKEGQETYDTLRSVLSEILSGSCLKDLCQQGSPSWRAILSLYFVWTGVFYYGEESGHDLWPAIMRGLGLEPDGNIHNLCGQMFMQCLQENELETFPSVDTGHRYVTPILLHGLIPKKHIQLFISEIIEPELDRPHTAFIRGEEVVRKWKGKNRLHLLPKPIQRFIKYGDPTNGNLVERFLEMARQWEGDDSTSWQQWGLPHFMVDAFRNYASTTGKTRREKKGSARFAQRPYVYFDLEQSDVPIMHIPSQTLEVDCKLQVHWVAGDYSNKVQTLSLNAIPIRQHQRSEPTDVEIGPSLDGWEIQETNSSGAILTFTTVPLHFPVTEKGQRVPLIFFCRRTGRLVNPRRDKALPRELLVVYPVDSQFQISDRQPSTEPIALRGEWQGWQYVLCDLGEDVLFRYRGTNVEQTETLRAHLPFSGTSSDHAPTLADNDQIPHWVRSADKRPIFASWHQIAIRYSEDTYRVWKRAFITLRRESDGATWPIDFQFGDADDHGCAAYLDASHLATLDLEPGRYTIHMRGSLGTEDVLLPFIYLPLTEFEQVVTGESEIPARFRFKSGDRLVSMEAIEPAVIQQEGDQFTVLLKEDRGEAFCGVKFFADTSIPVTLLFARSPLRWAHRNTEGIFRWESWRCRPEEITVARVNELSDARIAVQFDLDPMDPQAIKRKKPDLHLRIFRGDEENEQTVAAQNAITTYNRDADFWIVDLKKYRSLIESLRSVAVAELAIRSGRDGQEFPLFSILRQLSFQNLEVTVDGGLGKDETLTVNWTPQRNEPRRNRVVHVFPIADPSQGNVLSIKDDTSPPFSFTLKPAPKAELWAMRLEVRRSLFGGLNSSPGADPHFTWFRAPEGWGDWLEWPHLGPIEISRKVGTLVHMSQSIVNQAFSLSNFLLRFHQDKGLETFSLIHSILGDCVLRELLPFTRGTIWNVKSHRGKRLSLQIISSSADNADLGALLEERPPCVWCKLPEQIELELMLLEHHGDFGPARSTWLLKKSEADETPCLSNEQGKEFDLPYWIEDAVYPDEKGRLIARIDLEECWQKLLYLPGLNGIGRKDTWFSNLEREPRKCRERDRRFKGARESLGTFADLFPREKLQMLGHDDDSNKSEMARSLTRQWKKNLQKEKGLNPLLREIIESRLEYAGPNGLSGIAAFIARLTAHGLAEGFSPKLTRLYQTTLSFVKEMAPKGLLRDLIISEVIISWYWGKVLEES